MAMAIDLPSQEMIRKTSQQKSPPLPPQELVTGRSPGKGWPGQPLPVVSKEDEEEEDILHKVRKFREASRKKQQQQQQQPVEDAGTSRNVPEGLGIDVKPANGVDVVEEKQQPAEDLGTSRHVPQTITDRPSSTNNDILTKLGGNGSQGEFSVVPLDLLFRTDTLAGISLKGRSLQASGSSSSTVRSFLLASQIRFPTRAQIPQIRREPDQDEEDNVNGAAAEEGAASQETETTTTKARARKGGSAPRATKKRRKA